MAEPDTLPPDCLLIRRKREAMSPPMSMRAAARASGLPEATWRQAENGTRARTRDVLAAQALTVDVTPWELEQVGRDDAAEHLRTLLRKKLDAAAGIPGPLREAAAADPAVMAEVVHGLADIDRSDALTNRQKAELKAELIDGIMRDIGERRAHVRAVLRIAASQP